MLKKSNSVSFLFFYSWQKIVVFEQPSIRYLVLKKVDNSTWDIICFLKKINNPSKKSWGLVRWRKNNIIYVAFIWSCAKQLINSSSVRCGTLVNPRRTCSSPTRTYSKTSSGSRSSHSGSPALKVSLFLKRHSHEIFTPNCVHIM